MTDIIQYAKEVGYLRGVIMGQLLNIDVMRSSKLLSDTELLEGMINQLKQSLDTLEKGI